MHYHAHITYVRACYWHQWSTPEMWTHLQNQVTLHYWSVLHNTGSTIRGTCTLCPVCLESCSIIFPGCLQVLQPGTKPTKRGEPAGGTKVGQKQDSLAKGWAQMYPYGCGGLSEAAPQSPQSHVCPSGGAEPTAGAALTVSYCIPHFCTLVWAAWTYWDNCLYIRPCPLQPQSLNHQAVSGCTRIPWAVPTRWPPFGVSWE